MSSEYIGAIVLVIVAILKAFNIELASDAVTGIVTGVIAVWIAFKRHAQGDINLGGVKKPIGEVSQVKVGGVTYYLESSVD